jgi:diketogulonate reductase-like aldo/keto reductase
MKRRRNKMETLKEEPKAKRIGKSKYSVEVQYKCVDLVKSGMPLKEVTAQLGPNPKAIQRYCKKQGFVIPRTSKEKKTE